MGLDTSYDNISEVLSLLQRYKQKIIVHNGDNYTNKFYNMIYLDVNNKVNIKKNNFFMTFIPTHAQKLVIIHWMDSCIPKEEECVFIAYLCIHVNKVI